MKTPNTKHQTPKNFQLPSTNSRRSSDARLWVFGIWKFVGVWCLVFGVYTRWLELGAFAQDDPSTELASFQIADGFEVILFASEADGVVKPIQIRFDAHGRLWVIGSTVYPLIEPGQKPNDKVLVLEDTKHAGRADKVTVFADGLMIPTGL